MNIDYNEIFNKEITLQEKKEVCLEIYKRSDNEDLKKALLKRIEEIAFMEEAHE